MRGLVPLVVIIGALATLVIACVESRTALPPASRAPTEAYREARGMLKEMSPAGTVSEQEADFRKHRLARLLEQAQRFYDREQYAECEQMCMHILDLDPLNADVQALKLKARREKHEREEARRALEEKKRELETFRRAQGLKIEAREGGGKDRDEEGGLPAYMRLVYPEDWEQILPHWEKPLPHREAPEPAWKKAIRAKLDKKVAFEFVDEPLSDAINALQTMTRINMIIDPRATAGGADVPINLKVSDISLDLALTWMLKLAELDYLLREDGVFIAKPENLHGVVILKIYDVRDLAEPLTFGSPEIPELAAKREDAKKPPRLTVTGLAEMVQKRVKPESWAAELGTSIEERGGQLVVMQRPEIHKLIEKLLASFRERQKLFREAEKQFEKARREKKPTSSP